MAADDTDEVARAIHGADALVVITRAPGDPDSAEGTLVLFETADPIAPEQIMRLLRKMAADIDDYLNSPTPTNP
ncbi:hypothetical protein [Nocardia pseudovaccinii]|uniref:hypothetical protein n=1 Tax=Nocardia pseudovaccinii TaxID=189540 RepID=UPI0007A382F2|nr:hypothetical protein [Nocardia pseudovaccinii]